ncbi:PilZ domain-containing protein [Thermodesulfobacteriota bacterium]
MPGISNDGVQQLRRKESWRMKDAEKSREQLIEELNTMRQQVQERKGQEACSSPEDIVLDDTFASRDPRHDLNADIEFIGDFDLISAKGINISNSGLCLQLKDDLPFEMQFDVKGQKKRRRAYLVWLKRLPSGGYHFGFKFVDNESFPEF